jgi:ferredoxin
VTSSECISCNECVNACPAAGALEVERGRGSKLSPALVTGIVVGLIALVIGVSTVAGAFAWRMPTLGEAIEQQQESAGSESGSTFDPTVIKGYMSMKEISEATGIPEEEFVTKWGVPEADLSQPMKDIKDQYGFSPDDVKVWVAEELAK